MTGAVKVLIDNGTGKARKIFDVTSSTLNLEKRKALIGLHAFSGNNYISSFFQEREESFLECHAETSKIYSSLC